MPPSIPVLSDHLLLRQDRRGLGLNSRAVAPSLLNLGRFPHFSPFGRDAREMLGDHFRPHAFGGLCSAAADHGRFR